MPSPKDIHPSITSHKKGGRVKQVHKSTQQTNLHPTSLHPSIQQISVRQKKTIPQPRTQEPTPVSHPSVRPSKELQISIGVHVCIHATLPFLPSLSLTHSLPSIDHYIHVPIHSYYISIPLQPRGHNTLPIFEGRAGSSGQQQRQQRRQQQQNMTWLGWAGCLGMLYLLDNLPERPNRPYRPNLI